MALDKKYIISFDLGTSSLRSVLFNDKAEAIAIEQKEFTQYYPAKDHVEHDAEEIWQKIITCTKDLLTKNNIKPENIAGIGITNQRETTVIWDKNSGRPIYKAIVWQDSRTAEYCNNLNTKTNAGIIKSKTGLSINPYFSASKIRWILDNTKHNINNLKFGTIDTWILWNLTKGKAHATDYSNASRTLLFNITDLKWDNELLNIFNIPKNILPEVKPNISEFGKTDKSIFGAEIPILAMAGDQQSSLFGQLCFNEGDMKATYGTGCFILKNIGEKPIFSDKLLTTIAWGIDDKIYYGLEGAILNCASIINWLKNNLQIIKSGREADELAESVKDTNGVTFDIDLCGDSNGGEIKGLRLDTTKAHIVRAALEAIAKEVTKLIKIIENTSATKAKQLSVDGGVSKSDFLMNFQSNLLGLPIKRFKDSERTAYGVAYMAGIKAGLWDMDLLREIKSN